MKYEVLNKFYDRYTRELYKKGQCIEVSEERAKEILSVAELITPVQEEVKEAEEPKPKRTRRTKKTAE